MALTVTHAKNVAIADDPKAAAAGEVLPSDWNANHVVSGTVDGIRTKLVANTNYFVSATGSDSNGGTNSTTDAWATPQHAINFLSSNVDFSGFTVTVNVGAGSFTGILVLTMSGGGQLFLLGAGSASSTLTAGPNGTISSINNLINLPFFYSGFTLNCTEGDACVRVGINNQMWGVHPDFSTSDIVYVAAVTTPGYCVWVEGPSFWSDGEGVGTATINAGTWLEAFHIEPGAQNVQIGDAYTLSGTPAFNTFITCSDASAVVYATFTGGVTGTRFIVKNNGEIDAGDTSGTYFPGNAVGQILSGGQYSGITDYIGNVAGLPAAIRGAKLFITDSSTSATFGTTVVGGSSLFTPAYGDGTNYRYG